MAFSDFKAIPDVQEKFRITYAAGNFLGSVESLQPSAQFLSELEFSMEYIDIYASEGARCESVIYPILRKEGYIAYPLGLKGVVVGEGDTYEDAVADATSAIKFHIETFGTEALEIEEPALDVFITEAGVAV